MDLLFQCYCDVVRRCTWWLWSMRFNAKELTCLACQSSDQFDKEGVLFVKERQEGLFRKGEGCFGCLLISFILYSQLCNYGDILTLYSRVVGCWHGYLSLTRCWLAYAQLMPLPPTVSCLSEIQIGFTFLVPANLGSPRQRAVKWLLLL